jgi:hypothetical protein
VFHFIILSIVGHGGGLYQPRPRPGEGVISVIIRVRVGKLGQWFRQRFRGS